ncbi:MAG: hypothetical protein ACXWOL_17470 [Ktedonobacteraceae bacterium]
MVARREGLGELLEPRIISPSPTSICQPELPFVILSASEESPAMSRKTPGFTQHNVTLRISHP